MLKGRKGSVILALSAVVFSVVAIAIVTSAIYYLQDKSYFLDRPTVVMLTGNITTSGIGVSPSDIIFISQRTNSPNIVSIYGNCYCISLPNNDIYNVSITWKSAGTTYETDAGILKLDCYTSTLTRNWCG